MIHSTKGETTLTGVRDESGLEGSLVVTGDLATVHGRWRQWLRLYGVRVRGTIDYTDDRVRANAWVPIALIAALVCAFLFRFAAAQHLSSHVDEAASVMAAQMIAEKGVPVFPSGTLYLQGATISYVLAPLIKLGYGDLGDLLPLRLLSVFVGTVAVYFAFLLGRTVTRSQAAGFVTALLLAVDPVSVRWGGMVRMYALLQCLALIVIWLFVRALLRTPARRELVIMTAVFWAGVFTHIAICLFLPAMAIAAVLTYGRELQDKRRDLTVALIACAGAPVMLLGLNKVVSPADESASASLPGVSFVGDFLFSFDQILHPTIKSWTLLFSYSSFGAILPAVILAVSGVLAGRYFLGEPGQRAITVERKRIVSTLFLLYWLPIAAVAAVATEQNERYLIHIHPIGLALVVLLAYDLVANSSPALSLASARHRYAGPVEVGVAGRHPAPHRSRIAPGDSSSVLDARTRRGPAAIATPAWLSARLVAAFGFAAVIVAGAAIRISHLNHLSLWLDEGFSILYSEQEWRSVLGVRGFYSPHPPLYFTLVKVSDLLVSDQLAGRLISVIAGIATIPVFALLMARILDRKAAFVASLVLAVSPIHLYYSQEARMYALVVFLIAVSYLALVSYNDRPSLAWAGVFGVSAALALWVDYSSTYALAPQAAFILIQFYRHRRASAPLLAAGVLAVMAYLPWLPQVMDSIDAANLVERRETYLGVDQSRVTTALLSMMGFAGDGSYFQSLRETAWNRWPDSRGIFLLGVLPVVFLGFRGLWRRWEALLVVGGLLSTMLAGIWVSLISPGFAERTVLTTVLGWAALLGAAFSAKSSRLMRVIAAGSLAVVLLIQTSTIDVIFNGAIKQQWRTASADVETISTLNMPLVTYSYGAVADTLVDAYYPGLLDGMRVITIRDGNLENVLSNGVIPEVGLTRTYDIAAGRLVDVLPVTPENDIIWYLYYTREGEPDIRAAIRRAGYTRVLHNQYRAPRYQVFLDLFVRPGADLGPEVSIDRTFSGQEGGWALPETATVQPSTAASADTELTIPYLAAAPSEAFLLLDAPPETVLATFTVEFKTALPAEAAGVKVSCLSPGGLEISIQEAEVEASPGSAETWRSARVSALCPAATGSIKLSLFNKGAGELAFRNPAFQLLPIPPKP